MTLVAVATDENGDIATFAGRALTWQIYSVNGMHEISLCWTVNLTEFGSMHKWHVNFFDSDNHPLHQVDVAIAASAGNGVADNLAKRDTVLLTSDRKNPRDAIIEYLKIGNLINVDENEQICLDPEKRKSRANVQA